MPDGLATLSSATEDRRSQIWMMSTRTGRRSWPSRQISRARASPRVQRVEGPDVADLHQARFATAACSGRRQCVWTPHLFGFPLDAASAEWPHSSTSSRPAPKPLRRLRRGATVRPVSTAQASTSASPTRQLQIRSNPGPSSAHSALVATLTPRACVLSFESFRDPVSTVCWAEGARGHSNRLLVWLP